MTAIAAASGRLREWTHPVLAITCGALLLLCGPLVNGYPLVFPDTETYIRHGLELYRNPYRPPYYGLFLLLTNGSLSLWLSAIVQCALVSGVVYVGTICALQSRISAAAFGAVMLLLTILTPLPWISGQIMPDVWTPALLLLVFARAFINPPPRTALRIGFIIVIAAATSVHYGNLPLSAGLILTVAAVILVQSRRVAPAVPVLLDGSASVVLAAGAFLVFSLAVSGEAKLSPRGDVFFSARLVADGTARPYLEKTCPSNPTPFCESLVKPSLSSGDILWSDTSYLNRYKDAVAKVRDASQLVHGTMATNASGVLTASVRHTAEQLVSFGSFDTLCPEQCASLSKIIAKHYGAEFGQFISSRQMTGRLPLALSSVHVAVGWLSIIFLPLLFAWSWLTKRHALSALILLTAAGLIGNAFIIGTLSEVHDRYQSRMIWLVPLVYGIALIDWLASRKSTRPAA
jgi:hypothetical protein